MKRSDEAGVRASPEERALVPDHLTGTVGEQFFLEEFFAIKDLLKAEAEKIWNCCSNAHQTISLAATDEKRRVFLEYYNKWRDQLIGLQETLIIDRLLPLAAKHQIPADDQKWLLRAYHEVWGPITAGYLDWLTFAVLGHVRAVRTGAIPEWAWQLGGSPRDVYPSELNPEKRASTHFRVLAETLQRDLAEYRTGAIAKASLARRANESQIAGSGIRRLEPGADHGPATIQPDHTGRSRTELSTRSAPLSEFEATVGALMVQARKECQAKYLSQSEILKIAALLDDKSLPVRDNLERQASRSMAEYNKQHTAGAIKSWKAALRHPEFRSAVRKRFSRAEEKYKKTTTIASSAGTPRTTI